MRKLVNNRELSDVTFIVDGFPVYASRVHLALRSEHFRAMLYGGMRESEQGAEIEIKVGCGWYVLGPCYTGEEVSRVMCCMGHVVGGETGADVAALCSATSFACLTAVVVGFHGWLVFFLFFVLRHETRCVLSLSGLFLKRIPRENTVLPLPRRAAAGR